MEVPQRFNTTEITQHINPLIEQMYPVTYPKKILGKDDIS